MTKLHPKMKAATGGGISGTVLVAILARRLHVELEPEEVGIIVAAAAVFAGWLQRAEPKRPRAEVAPVPLTGELVPSAPVVTPRPAKKAAAKKAAPKT